jgi:RNA polymerase sigma factor (TIGR02999 family)
LGTPQSEVTRLLLDWSAGNQTALDQLMPLVYDELRRLASSYLRSERPGHTLEPTGLIHEAYMRLVDQSLPQWENRSHFFGVAARLMRQILVDHARSRGAVRRGGNQKKISIEDTTVFSDDHAAELIAFDEALRKLAELDERKARIIEMQSFGGMTSEETAEALGISVPTVKRDLKFARAWLKRELNL